MFAIIKDDNQSHKVAQQIRSDRETVHKITQRTATAVLFTLTERR